MMAMLLYGAGLRLRECMCLRVKDRDFSRNEIVLRERKICRGPRFGEPQR